MIVFNTFTNYQRIKRLPETDILIWTTGLLNLKYLGYTTKIYCTEADVPFLREWGLYDLYDQVDTELFEDNEMLGKIDNKHFWSTRKIEAMHHQLSVLNEPAVYVDTDVIMRSRFDLSKDALVWSPEEWFTDEGQIYVPWRNLSKPNGYTMPRHVLDTKDAYNCGVLWFRDKGLFEEWRNEYYAFCLGNPCKIKLHRSRGDKVEDLVTNDAVWACNAEQRILKAVLDHANADVACVMSERKKGWSRQGSHFFHYRVCWKYMNEDPATVAPDAVPMLNLTVYECLRTLKGRSDALYVLWKRRPWLDGFEDGVDLKEGKFPLNRYV